MMPTPKLVLFGGPNSGKTHYAGQLYGRITRCADGRLTLRKSSSLPPSLELLQEVLTRLENGELAGHTPTDIWGEITLPLIDNERNCEIDLSWPDYAGEHIEGIFKRRKVSSQWLTKLTNASGWILFLRLGIATVYEQSSSNFLNTTEKDTQIDPNVDIRWDDNAYWVEILQILLHSAGIGTVAPVKEPRLSVLLSCYDELGTEDSLLPCEVLQQRLPLLSSFLSNVWGKKSLSVWGLSSLGCSLASDDEKKGYKIKSPERFGWVVPPDGGHKNPDLTLPLAELLI